jgi:hypothetical protein
MAVLGAVGMWRTRHLGEGIKEAYGEVLQAESSLPSPQAMWVWGRAEFSKALGCHVRVGTNRRKREEARNPGFGVYTVGEGCIGLPVQAIVHVRIPGNPASACLGRRNRKPRSLGQGMKSLARGYGVSEATGFKVLR